MFKPEDMHANPLDGELGSLITLLNDRTAWGQREQDLRARLISRLETLGVAAGRKLTHL